jgi:hypothetical protein
MPARYEAMRDKFESQGMSAGAAKGKAARIYNGTRKPGEAPVTRNYDKTKALHAKVRKGLKKAFGG